MIAAEGEQKASSALREAAEVIQQSPHALQVNKQNRFIKFKDYVLASFDTSRL